MKRKYIGMYIKNIRIDEYSSKESMMIDLEYNFNGEISRKTLLVTTSLDLEGVAFTNISCSHLSSSKEELIGLYINSVCIKKVKNGFLIIFTHLPRGKSSLTSEEEWEYKKYFLPAYSVLDTYYSDDVTLEIYLMQKKVISEKAINGHGSSEYNLSCEHPEDVKIDVTKLIN